MELWSTGEAQIKHTSASPSSAPSSFLFTSPPPSFFWASSVRRLPKLPPPPRPGGGGFKGSGRIAESKGCRKHVFALDPPRCPRAPAGPPLRPPRCPFVNAMACPFSWAPPRPPLGPPLGLLLRARGSAGTTGGACPIAVVPVEAICSVIVESSGTKGCRTACAGKEKKLVGKLGVEGIKMIPAGLGGFAS